MPIRGPTDSWRLVQASHATLAGLRVHAWFDYVRSKANVSDEPSREPSLDSACMRVGGCVHSEPRMLLLPEAQAWDSEAAEWALAADLPQ